MYSNENINTTNNSNNYRVYAKIDLNAIYDNIVNAKKCIKKDTKFMAVIKADGYGHGACEIANKADELIDAYGVATVDEGMELRKNGIKKPILILGNTFTFQAEDIINYEIDTAVSSYETVKIMSETAVKLGKTLHVHIALDTGMSRIGFLCNEAHFDESVEEIIKVSKLDNVKIDGCFSHFATMDETDKSKALEQFNKYIKMTETLKEKGVDVGVRHIANSAGIMEDVDVELDMVRDGICLYGLYPSEEVDETRLSLKPAMSLYSKISHIKTLEEGIEIGYGGTFTTPKTMRVATVPVGYADGYPRSLSNKGSIIIKGVKVPIIGRVCMDQFMVDVSDVSDVKVGDEVTLIGRDGDEFISVEEASLLAGSFNYEFVCDVSKRVPRIYIG
ncbi:MAG: alanine racemase [Lachnospiraceae bacterium]|nr:alanine racemase [Lachnospiraceae bacterium]